MRDRVLAAAARTRQLPAEVTTHAQPRRSASPARWVPWLSATVAVASVVVAVLFGFAQARTEAELRQVRADSQAISALLSSPQARLLSHGTARGGTATVVLDAARHELAVITTGMPALPPGQVYQLWLIGKQRVSSAGLLPAARDGRTAPVLATGVTAGDTLGMTVEPAPGTARPTTAPILALPLPA
jgi:anti-sigma-K factor RskA